MSVSVEEVLGKLEGVHGTEGNWTARCPAHADTRNSLSIGLKDDGRPNLNCHAGCEWRAIVAALAFTPKDFLPEEGGNGHKGGKAISKVYDYTDAAGRLLFQVVRFVPKDFRQRHPCPRGADGWTWSLGGKCGCPKVPDVPYRLPELLEAVAMGRTVYVVEGEKDVENLRALGLPATTNAGGAVKWKKAHAEHLAGASVVILPDKDEAGRNHAKKVSASLKPLGASVRVLELPGPGKDASDWIAAGGTAEQLEALVSEAAQKKPAAPSDSPDRTALYDLKIIQLVRQVAVNEVRFDLHMSWKGRAVAIARLPSADLATYRVIRNRALDSCVLLPTPCKDVNAAWAELLEEALLRVEEVAPDPQGAGISAIREEIENIIGTAVEPEPGEAMLMLRRNEPIRHEGFACIFPQGLVRRIRASLRDDLPTREAILDAARSLKMTERRARLDTDDRPRLWAFPLPQGATDAPAPADLFSE